MWTPVIKNIDEVKSYQQEAKNKSEIERTDMTKEKTGVKIDGLKAINPVNNSVGCFIIAFTTFLSVNGLSSLIFDSSSPMNDFAILIISTQHIKV